MKLMRGLSLRSDKAKRSNDDCEKILVRLGENWSVYPKEVTAALRGAYLKGHDQVKFTMYVTVKHRKHANQKYRVNFRTMHQVNAYSGKTRQIKFVKKGEHLANEDMFVVMEGGLDGTVDLMEDDDDDGYKSMATDDARSITTSYSTPTLPRRPSPRDELRRQHYISTGERTDGVNSSTITFSRDGRATETITTVTTTRIVRPGEPGAEERIVTEVMKGDPMLAEYRRSEAGARKFFGREDGQDSAAEKKQRRSLLQALGEDFSILSEKDSRSKVKEVGLLSRDLRWTDFELVELAALRKQAGKLDRVATGNGLSPEERRSITILTRRIGCIIRLMNSNILVFCRARVPASPAEANFTFPQGKTQIQPIEASGDPRGGPKKYTFDAVFTDETQEELFEEVRCLFEPVYLNNTISIFATGRSNTGKTYTMYGSQKRPGFVPRTAAAIFDCAQARSVQYTSRITCSMLELYLNTLIDLLRHDEDGVVTPLSIVKNATTGQLFVNNAVHDEIANVDDFNKVMEKGFIKRKTAALGSSSSSTLILRLDAFFTNKETGTVSHSKYFLVDMAGTESLASKDEAKAAKIQESMKAVLTMLSTLGAPDHSTDAISAKERLSMCRKHILTEILSEAFGDRAKAILFANVADNSSKQEDYINTLRYGAHASRLKQPQDE
eukprot:GEMP01017407.1.p1 GENE.GEMP01017407.1~~GEMP01017407.1.p1  ORF type:complete len:669 (+),score=113.52 GEMP01017407.1:126-2132(+)